MKRRYYAQYCPYGTRTLGGEKLCIFNTESERDAWVEADQWDGSDFHREAISAAYAYHRYGNAIKYYPSSSGNKEGSEI